MDIPKAQNYLSFLFIHHSVVLDKRHLGRLLLLRDYRQVMCSMLCSLSGMDYGAPDPDDHDLLSIHSQFGHSSVVANAHYGIQGTNALATILHTTVQPMQQVSA
ncbi:hypothetical protein J3R83DRAFT_3378 [Lanmaoa asiatica]|nr:hypothetical protein J3R83DRAFT_3378 [Lanmaoa asiatica]